MYTTTIRHRPFELALALGVVCASGVGAQTMASRADPTRMAYVCRVTPVKVSASDTAYAIWTNDRMADSTRLAVNGATVRCGSATRTGTSGGDVALEPRRVASSTRIPVSKEPPMPVAAAPVDTPMTPAPTPVPEPPPVVVDSPRVELPPPAPEPAPVVMKRYRNGFYIGLGGGSGIPTEALREAYDPGATVVVPIGWDSPTGPFGVRLNLGYTNLDSRRSFRTTGLATAPGTGTTTTAVIATDNPQIWSAMADLKLRFPFSGFYDGARSGLYIVGGGGVNYFRHYNTSFALTNPEFNNGMTVMSSRESLTRGALNAGGGLSWGLGTTEVFLESRYVTTFTNGRRASYVPITIGLAFH